MIILARILCAASGIAGVWVYHSGSPTLGIGAIVLGVVGFILTL